jgi:nucleoside-diphosphate-sugar epimerase
VWHATQPAPLPGADDLRCDLEDSCALAALPCDVDVVIHSAARIPAGSWSDEAAASSNLRLDRGLLEHYERAGFAGRWVQLSSVILQHAELRDRSDYANAKAQSEERAASAFPHRARSLRISSPYGVGMRQPNVLRRFAEAARSGQPITLIGTAERTQDFVHADDVARAALAAAIAPGGRPVVVASGAPVSMAELARLVVEVSGSDSPIQHAGVPDPQDGFRADYSLDPALEDLGWQPAVRLEDGLRTMLAAM